METHEEFIGAVRTIALERAVDRGTIGSGDVLGRGVYGPPAASVALDHAKLVYGVGDGSYRGVCHYAAWSNGIGTVDVVEVAATAEESWVQLTGTVLHELGHVLAGWSAGHGPEWRAAAERLGLRTAKAAGMRYTLAAFDPIVRERVASIAEGMADGSPAFRRSSWLAVTLTGAPRPCSAGIGTRGGRSRGAGSGSRSLKIACESCGYVARVSRRWLDVGAPYCGADVDHGRMIEA